MPSEPEAAPVPEQPTLREGDLVLRPWRITDAEPARLQHDEQMAYWFGWDELIPSIEQQTNAIERWQHAYADGRKVVAFAVEHAGHVVGAVEVKQRGDRVGELSWAVFAAHRRQGFGARAVRLLIDYCFTELDLVRVAARIEVGNEASLRTAAAAGMCEEGIARQEATTLGRRSDFVHVARLAHDPPPRGSDPSPKQPTLRDDEITIRPWTLADLEATIAQHDDRISYWFGEPGFVPTIETQRAAFAEWRRDYADGRRRVMFLVERAGQVAGWVDVTQRGEGRGELSWGIYPAHRNQRVATRAVRLLVWYCFSELGLLRVEARVESTNLASLRTAGRAGLRREGLARQEALTGTRRGDMVHLARLVTDPPPNDRVGFNEILNAALPKKHVIVQGLLRNTDGQLLLCELVYKRDWDLPGGIVDPGESPTVALRRELAEELGLDLPARRLLLVNWLPPWRGWEDACLLVFDLGVHDASIIEALTTEEREIAAVHWCAPEDAPKHVAPYLATLLPVLHSALLSGAGGPVYLEAGMPVGEA